LVAAAVVVVTVVVVVDAFGQLFLIGGGTA
jgi:hypothetical protein